MNSCPQHLTLCWQCTRSCCQLHLDVSGTHLLFTGGIQLLLEVYQPCLQVVFRPISQQQRPILATLLARSASTWQVQAGLLLQGLYLCHQGLLFFLP